MTQRIDLKKAREKLEARERVWPGDLVNDLFRSIIDALDPPAEQPFDWATVKPGMAFRSNGWVGIYVGPLFEPVGGDTQVFQTRHSACLTSGWNNIIWRKESDVIRAPEHDRGRE